VPDGQDVAALEALDHDSVGDRHVRELIERYVLVAGATLTELAPHLYEMFPPPQDRAAFNGRTSIRLAFSVEAVQTDPVAEMAILGGGFIEQLITAIRSRGTRRHAGAVGAADSGEVAQPGLPVIVRRGSVGAPTSQFARHRLGRLTARVVIRAGTALEEHLVDSDIFDLTTGLVMSADVAAECAHPTVEAPMTDAAAEAPPRPPKELVPMLLANLEGALRPQIDALAQKAERELAHESGRIQRYYSSLLEDIGGRGTDIPDANSRRVIEAERDRRVAEETDRHQVRATVHPVQLTEWDALVQRVEWPLASHTGHRAALSAQRVLAGDRSWLLGCPTCGTQSPGSVTVCVHEHVGCDSCSRDCSVCSDSFCTAHGIAACHVDQAPACSTHSRTCKSCLRAHCSQHEGICVDGGHPTCTTCLSSCATCGRSICDRHAELSHDSAPRGARRFCHDCACKCEGGSNEIVGKDEVAQCSSCERMVCERHQARCAVDGHVHCSTHLRRTDRSRRLVCEKDRAGCAFEPTAVFAIDEISACSECGLKGCDQHVLPCDADGRKFCHTHLLEPRDKPGARVCREHHTICHVDGAPFTATGTKDCPACGKRACPEHSRDCRTCDRSICTGDSAADGRCSTCTRLTTTPEPSDDVIAAANRLFESAGRAKSWRTARDASHTIVEADLGWTRRVTFVLRHGEQRAERANSTSMLGAKKLPT
jgi:hypothetical protein